MNYHCKYWRDRQRQGHFPITLKKGIDGRDGFNETGAVANGIKIIGRNQVSVIKTATNRPTFVVYNELDTPTIAHMVPTKLNTGTASRFMNATPGSEVHLHQTEPPNALSDSQVTACQAMAVLGWGDGYASPVTLTSNNCLFSGAYGYGVLVVDSGAYSGGDNYNLNNCTVNGIYYLAAGPNYNNNGQAVNSIFAGVQNVGSSSWQNSSYNGFYNSYVTFGSPQYPASSYPFHASGSDSYYLAADQPFRNVGTTDIGYTLLMDLQTLTTFAPQDGHTADNDWLPDLGYHYPFQDSDHDGLPDWWELYWFGNLNQTGSSLDASGNTLATDYQNYLDGAPTDPNIIAFTIETTNNYVSHTNASMQLSISGGFPAKYAVSVDDTNYSVDASWQTFTTTNLTVNLGSTQGWHEVWIALKGPATNATVTWEWKRLKLDTTAPQLTITSPTNGTVNEPMIQVTGFSPEPLAHYSYDLSNALGLVTNQQVLITDEVFSTNAWEFTTNAFQAFDVPLTNGVNTFTFHAMDMAGNTSTLTTNFTLDYAGKTNPVIQLFWPQNGEQISGGNFTWRGWVDDPTATIVASITDTNGNTTVVPGYTERNGNFWVEDLPMPNGTNSLMLAVTNAAGCGSTTNIFVSTNPLTVTMTPIPDDQLWNQTVTATGSISDSSYSLWINGVKAGVTNGVWTANNVPMTPGGVAIFNITTYAPGETQPDNSHGN